MATVKIKRGDEIYEVSDLSVAEVKELIGVNGHLRDSVQLPRRNYRRQDAGSGTAEPDFRGFYDSLSEKGKEFLHCLQAAGSKGVEAKKLAETLGFKSGNQIGGLAGGGLGKQAPKFHINLDHIYTSEVKFTHGVRERIFKPGKELESILR